MYRWYMMIYIDLLYLSLKKCGVSIATLNNQWVYDVSIHVSRIKYQRNSKDSTKTADFHSPKLDHLSRKVYMIYIDILCMTSTYYWHVLFFLAQDNEELFDTWMILDGLVASSALRRYAHTNPTTRALCKMCSISASNFDLLDLFWFQICLVFDIFGCL